MSDNIFEYQERLRILEEDQAVLDEILPELRRRRIAEGRKYRADVAARMQQELNRADGL